MGTPSSLILYKETSFTIRPPVAAGKELDKVADKEADKEVDKVAGREVGKEAGREVGKGADRVGVHLVRQLSRCLELVVAQG